MKKIKGKKIILYTLILCFFGMLMIYSASFYSANIKYGDNFYFVKKQFISFLLGCILFFVTAFFNYRRYYKFRWYIIGVSVLILMLVFIPGVGVVSNGARRWIGFGGFTLQSSEISKFGFVIFTACYMSKNPSKMKTIKGIIPIIMAGGLTCSLILLEPNLSVTLCVGMVMLLMLFVGGIKIKHFLLILIPALALVPILIIIEPYRLQRLTAFLNPWANPQEEGFQLIQSLYSLGGGGLFGVGLFNSRQKFLFLPFSESDFIFSIIGEEFGFIGCVLLCLLFILLIIEGIKIAYKASDRLGCYLAFGITSLIAVQLLINITVVTGLIPPTGIPLPFISAGGTSISVFMASIGILVNIANSSEKTTNDMFKNIFATKQSRLSKVA